MPPRPENGITWRNGPEGCLRFQRISCPCGLEQWLSMAEREMSPVRQTSLWR